MSMSKKDYVAVAAKIANRFAEAGSAERSVIRVLVDDLADVFAADNPRFDRAVFLKACGVA